MSTPTAIALALACIAIGLTFGTTAAACYCG